MPCSSLPQHTSFCFYHLFKTLCTVQFSACLPPIPSLCSGGRAPELLQREQELRLKGSQTPHTPPQAHKLPFPFQQHHVKRGKKQQARVEIKPTSDTAHGLSLAQQKLPHTYFNFGFGVLKTLSSSSISGPLSLGFSISSVSYRRSKSSSTSGTCSAGSCSESRTYTGQKQLSPTLLGARLIPHHPCSPHDCSTPGLGGGIYSWC